MPKTSGIPMGVFYGLGIAVAGLGFKIKKEVSCNEIMNVSQGH